MLPGVRGDASHVRLWLTSTSATDRGFDVGPLRNAGLSRRDVEVVPVRTGVEMGNRANFVIVKDQDWQVYYSHWAGCRMLDALIGGPDLALRYVESLRACAKNDWVDPLWADGGALVDLDRRRLLFFGDGLMVSMPERRAMMAVLAAMWPGYAIGWAYDGTIELAGYVGANLRLQSWDDRPGIKLADDLTAMCHLVSVVDAAGRVRMWPLWWGDLNKAWHGPALLDLLPGRGLRRVALGKIPEGGVHIDVSRKTVGVWETADAMGIFRALPHLWSGWTAECWEDRFDEQVLGCKGALRVPALDLAAGVDDALKWIRRRVFESFADSPAGQISKIAGWLAPLAPGMKVGEYALVNDGVRPRPDEWARFVAACDALRAQPAVSA